MGPWQDILEKPHCQSGLGLPSSFLSSWGGGLTVLCFHYEQIDGLFGQPTFFLFIFSTFLFSIFFFSLSFSPDTQALQCMLISLQAELDIQRYLMKIESSQRVSTLPFLFSASSRTHLLPFYSAMCGILIGVSRQTEHLYFSPVCPET